jgi:acetolactate synthase-1/2/3 large subunit
MPIASQNKTFSDDLAWGLAELGIKDAFLVTGGAIAPFTAALVEQGRINMHYMLTEQLAGIAAEAYGYIDGMPALLIVTSGPGVTNALTPVGAAWTNSSPVIVISGQARSGDVQLSKHSQSRQIGNQHLRTDLLVQSIVKLFIEIDTAVDGQGLSSLLYGEATSGRPGPVWLSIPQDIQRGPKSTKQLTPNLITYENAVEISALAAQIANALESSIQPSILVGNGARDAIDAISGFAKHFNIPVLTTWPGMDLVPFDNPQYCGRPGSIPSSWTPNFVNQETDFLLIVGARLDLGQVGYNPDGFAPNAQVIRIDVDPAEFDRIPIRDWWNNFACKSIELIPILNGFLVRKSESQYSDWWKRINEWKMNYPAAGEIKQDFNDGVSSYDLLKLLSPIFPHNFIVTGSSGTCMEMLLQSWQVQDGQRIINSCGLGSMGFGIPAAFGVATKFPNKEILCIESDGSFSMNLQALHTLSRSNNLFKIVIMDSSGYKSIHLSQNRLGQVLHGNDESTQLSLPNIESIASAFEIPVRILKSSDKIKESLTWLSEISSSAILVVKVSTSEEAFPRLVSKANALGVMHTPPMNQLFPDI